MMGERRGCVLVVLGRILMVTVGLVCVAAATAQTQPNFIFLLADDLGWNDVSWHDAGVLTPNLQQLVDEGVVLDQSYVQPVCTPTRSALLSGYYPYHLGRQDRPIPDLVPTGLTINVTLLPERLSALGYNTHMIGKWHLGFCDRAYIPTERGFHTFLGHYLGANDYFNHSSGIYGTGYDLRDYERVAWEGNGTYSTDLFAARAVEILQQQEEKENPFFIYLAFQNPHFPLEAPDEYLDLYPDESDPDRRTVLGMVTAMDDAVGRVVAALRASRFANNTLIIFSSDNGAPTPAGVNLPLRGGKDTLWEGGTRSPGLLHGSMLANTPRVHNGLLHVTDWYTTLMAAAGASTLPQTDGFNQWDILRTGQGSSPRESLIYNLNETSEGVLSGAIRVGRYKLILGQHGSEEEGSQLYDLEEDESETTDLAAEHPDMVTILEDLLLAQLDSMVPSQMPDEDPAGDASNFGGVWSPGWCVAN